MKKICSILILFFCLTLSFGQSILEPEVLNKLQASVYEVIVNKAAEGNIEYEKELPFSKLPFAIRTDKYEPIGTAFLTEDGEFYSAAHVFNIYEASVYNDYYIRDRNGNIYEVDKITKFATNRDFISFTVKDFQPEDISGLKISDSISLNTTVFSVGNALGDGIVIRNGLLTSQTFEEENGEWKWLRFSAAASPGNSGGPLVNPQGEILGIITMKSENENLNYALPFNEVNNVEDNIGYTYLPLYYNLPNILTTAPAYTFEKTVSLPLPLKELQSQLIGAFEQFATDIVKELTPIYAYKGKKGLATLKGKADILNTYYASAFPLTFYLTDKSKWSLSYPNTETYEIDENVTIEIGSMMNLYMANIQIENDVTLESLLNNPKTYMDYLFLASGFSRGIGGEQIAITSLGQPKNTTYHKDALDRIWQVATWDIDFANSKAISFSIPLPTGLYTIFTIAPNADASAFLNDIKFLTDFQNITYMGSIKEWKEYLSLPEKYLTQNTDRRKKIEIKELEDSTIFTVGEFELNLKDEILKTDDETNLYIYTGLKEEKDKCIEHYFAFDIYTNPRKEDYKYIHINKTFSPLEGAQKSTVEKYEQMLSKVAPYNNEPYNYEQYTYLDTVFSPQGDANFNSENKDYLYVGSFELLGQNKNQEILEFSQKIIESIKINPISQEDIEGFLQKTETTQEEIPAPKPKSSGFFSRFK